MNDYEKNLNELREITRTFSEGELSLEESVALFEKGVKAADSAMKELKKTYGKIMELKTEMDSVFTVPFEGERKDG